MRFAEIYVTISLIADSFSFHFLGGITVKRFISIALAVFMLCMLMVSCGEVSVEDEIKIPIRTGNTVNYNTAHAIIGTLREQVTLPGIFTTPYTMDLSFTRMSGRIATISVRQDQEVHEGDVIAVLDDGDLEEEIVIQKLSLDSAQNLYNTLVSKHASSEEIEFARIDLEIEQYKYDALIESREYLTLRAPFDGRITSINNYRVGSYIGQNSSFCTISDSSKVCLTVRDNAGLLTNVAFGTRVDVNQGALAATSGKVVDTLTAEFSVSDWRNFGDFGDFGGFGGGNNIPSEVTVYVIQCDDEIEFSDLGGIEVTFTTLRRDDAVIVPIEAVYEATDSMNVTSSYVNVLVNGIKVQTAVTVGIVTGGRAEILNGLDGSETVILP